MGVSGQKGKLIAGLVIAFIVIVASQAYPKNMFSKYTGLSLPILSIAVKWYSDDDDLYAAFLASPAAARKLITRNRPGKEWRNDTLNVRLSPTHRNVPFFDIMGNELIRSDKERWFLAHIRKLDSRRSLHKGYAIIVYPEKGVIKISAGE